MKPWEAGNAIDCAGHCPEPGGALAWGFSYMDKGTGELLTGGGYAPARPGSSLLLATLFGVGTALKAVCTNAGRKPGILVQCDDANVVDLLNAWADFPSPVPNDADAVMRATVERVIILTTEAALPGGGCVVQRIETAENVAAAAEALNWWERGKQRTGEAA